MTKTKSQKGFSLIELLVVISILGILATMLIVNFSSSRARARDAARKSDLRNVKTALRLYYNDFQQYPPNGGSDEIYGCGVAGDASCGGWGGTASFSSGTGPTVYMNHLPSDPMSLNQEYAYTQISPDTFTLITPLENHSDPDITRSQAVCQIHGPFGTYDYVVCED